MLITSYTRPIRLLHLESSEQDHELVKFALRRSGGTFDVVRAQTLREFCDQIDTVNYDVILSDYRFADFTAIDAWSEVLDADTVDWFTKHGGLSRSNGDRFRTTLLSRGGSQDALSLFRNFTGADPDIEPLLKRRGLDQSEKAKKPGRYDG